MPRTRDTGIVGYKPLLSPAALLEELALSETAVAIVERARIEVRAVLDGSDDCMFVIDGPCSVHDSVAALDYAGRLAAPALGAISRRGTARRPRTHCDGGRLPH